MNDKEIIRWHGGPTALAEKLGYPKPHGVQRCGNWMRRGIPLAVRVSRPDLFPEQKKEEPSNES
ncbi:MAG: hypothetical protein LBE22_10485 [Azoarcus sp.]|jgi:hypothetical protein|nr:hypothetical protein [Azoarcus sp.]